MRTLFIKCPQRPIGLCSYFIHSSFTQFYSTSSPSVVPVKFYSNADTQKLEILKENRGKCGIYRWVNQINGKSYVGSAVNLSKRLSEHFIGNKSNIIIQQAFDKYGLSNFSVEILEYCDQQILIEREQYYLDLINKKYNLNPVAGSRLGAKHSEESRQKMSERLHSEETRKKISKALSGYKHPQYGLRGENSHNYGKTHSEETKF